MKQATTIPATSKPRKPRAKKNPAETLLHIDLWSDEPSNPLQPLAAQMVADLIRSTAGDLQNSTGATVSAAYPSTRQAIAAARSLCPLIDGFSTTTHAAFTLCYTGDLAHRDPSPAEPQRILLIGAICDTARTIPGLRFRELPPTANCATLELLTSPHHQRAAAPPLAPKPLEAPSQTPAKLPVRSPSTPPQQSPAAPNPKRRIKIFAAAASVVLAGIIAFVFIPRPSAKSQPPPTTPPPTPIAAVIPPAPAPQPTPAPPVAVAPKPPAEPHKRPSPPLKANQPPPQQKLKPPPVEHEAAQSPSSSGITFLPAEIKGMLARAEKLSGDGNYNGAIAVYDAVLRADRHNGPASEGRQRAIYNRDHR